MHNILPNYQNLNCNCECHSTNQVSSKIKSYFVNKKHLKIGVFLSFNENECKSKARQCEMV